VQRAIAAQASRLEKESVRRIGKSEDWESTAQSKPVHSLRRRLSVSAGDGCHPARSAAPSHPRSEKTGAQTPGSRLRPPAHGNYRRLKTPDPGAREFAWCGNSRFRQQSLAPSGALTQAKVAAR